ncbi:MAG: hypothetical protein U9N48_01675 [Euryarchaeota archaeon]|nr:hypothetical protein [Euryarchaeota archaeon]
MESDNLTIEDRVICTNCGYEIATVLITVDGKRQLRVHHEIALTVDKQQGTAYVKCPECGVETPTNLDFWSRF